MDNVFWAAFGGAAAAGIITMIALLTAEWFRWFLDRPLVKVELKTASAPCPNHEEFGDLEATSAKEVKE